jgi:hypothetical protein
MAKIICSFLTEIPCRLVVDLWNSQGIRAVAWSAATLLAGPTALPKE